MTWFTTYTGHGKFQEIIEIIKRNRKFRFIDSYKITNF